MFRRRRDPSFPLHGDHHKSGAACGGTRRAQIRKLPLQRCQGVLEHLAVPRMLTCLDLLLQVGTSEQQGLPFSHACRHFRWQLFLARFYSF